ncbi:MAG: hypothetical protein ACI9BK_001418, partial [Acidimicrobiales bacterium]
FHGMEEVRSSILLSSTHKYAVLARAGTAFCDFGHAGEPFAPDGSPEIAKDDITSIPHLGSALTMHGSSLDD